MQGDSVELMHEIWWGLRLSKWMKDESRYCCPQTSVNCHYANCLFKCIRSMFSYRPNPFLQIYPSRTSATSPWERSSAVSLQDITVLVWHEETWRQCMWESPDLSCAKLSKEMDTWIINLLHTHTTLAAWYTELVISPTAPRLENTTTTISGWRAAVWWHDCTVGRCLQEKFQAMRSGGFQRWCLQCLQMKCQNYLYSLKENI